jgi:hypothetical protein
MKATRSFPEAGQLVADFPFAHVKFPSFKPYWRVTLWYLAFGVVWIFLTDSLVGGVVRDVHALTGYQTLKGWFFVAISGLLIFQITRTAFRRHEAQEREKMRVYRKTVEGAHHILLNYLNQMQLVTMEAERCKDFDAETARIAHEVSDEAAAELLKLGALEKITEDEIHAAVYRRPRKAG